MCTSVEPRGLKQPRRLVKGSCRCVLIPEETARGLFINKNKIWTEWKTAAVVGNRSILNIWFSHLKQRIFVAEMKDTNSHHFCSGEL